ncbi:MAG: DnaK suppressor protein [Maribacter sp.]|jgi:DnaK suppressor protein
MTEEEKALFKEKLDQTIIDTKKTIERLIVETQPISPENSLGRITRMDAINNKSVAEAALRLSKRKLGKLHLSMSKLEDLDFGKCSKCSSGIALPRLMFMPESTYCVRCASRM